MSNPIMFNNPIGFYVEFKQIISIRFDEQMNMLALLLFLEAVFCSSSWRREESIEGCCSHALFNCCLTDFLCSYTLVC